MWKHAFVTRSVAAALLFVLWTGQYLIAGETSSTDTLPCATVTFLEGETYVLLPPNGQRRLVVSETLSAGSILRTGAGAKLELTFADHGIVRLNENTSVALAIDPDPARSPVENYQLMLMEGRLWANLPAAEPDRNTLQVLTAGTLFLGPGSVFLITVYPDGAGAINVYGGQVTAAGPFEITKDDRSFLLASPELGGPGDIEPWQYRIESYRKLIVQSTGKGTKPFRFAARSASTAWARWNQQRDETGK